MRFSPVPAPDAVGPAHAFPVPAYREVQPLLVIELRRARRYDRALSVALLSLEAPARARGGAAPPAPLAGLAPAVYGLLGSYLRNALRETDILTAAPESLAFAVFLPETDRGGAERALERFRAGFLVAAGYPLRGGVAAFPGDGLTIEDVLDRACEAWHDASRAEDDGDALAEARQSHG
jgi:hypothetical protein